MTISSNTRCLLDSNILVAYTVKESSNHRKALNFFQTVIDGKLKAFISTQNLLELSAVLTRAYKLTNKQASFDIEKFISDPLIEIVYPNSQVMGKFNQLLKEKFKVHVTDLFLVATALSYNIGTIITDDRDFTKIKGIKAYNPFRFTLKKKIS